MPARRLDTPWLRGVAVASACLFSLTSTAHVVASASHSGLPANGLLGLAQPSDGNGGGDNGNGNGSGEEHKHKPLPTLPPIPVALPPVVAPPIAAAVPPARKPHPVVPPGIVTPTAPQAVPVAPAHTPVPTETAAASTAAGAAPLPHAQVTHSDPVAVVLHQADPAPFTQSLTAADTASSLLPTERLGPLSGLSFGKGLVIWPLLLALDILALAGIARMALRRRLTSPGD